MKYIHLILYDYIRPLLKIHQNSKENLKIKSDTEKESKLNPEVNSSGMGDYDYKNWPVSVNSEDEEYNKILKKTEHFLNEINKELAIDYKERKNLEERLNKFEKDLEKRHEIYQLCADFCEEGQRAVDKCSETILNFENNIKHHEEILESWKSLIEDFRKIPEDNSYSQKFNNN